MNKKLLILLPILAMSMTSCTQADDKFALPKGATVNFENEEEAASFENKVKKGLNKSTDKLASAFSANSTITNTSIYAGITGVDTDTRGEVVSETVVEGKIYDVNVSGMAAVKDLGKTKGEIQAAASIDDFDAKFKLYGNSSEDETQYISVEGKVEDVAASVYLNEGNLYCDFSNENLKSGFEPIVAAALQYAYGEKTEETLDEYLEIVMNTMFVKAYYEVFDETEKKESASITEVFTDEAITDAAEKIVDFLADNVDGKTTKAYTYEGDGFGIEVNLPYEVFETMNEEYIKEGGFLFRGDLIKKKFSKDTELRIVAVFNENSLLERIAVEGKIEWSISAEDTEYDDDGTKTTTGVYVGCETKSCFEFAYGSDVTIEFPNFESYILYEEINLPEESE